MRLGQERELGTCGGTDGHHCPCAVDNSTAAPHVDCDVQEMNVQGLHHPGVHPLFHGAVAHTAHRLLLLLLSESHCATDPVVATCPLRVALASIATMVPRPFHTVTARGRGRGRGWLCPRHPRRRRRCCCCRRPSCCTHAATPRPISARSPPRTRERQATPTR